MKIGAETNFVFEVDEFYKIDENKEEFFKPQYKQEQNSNFIYTEITEKYIFKLNTEKKIDCTGVIQKRTP